MTLSTYYPAPFGVYREFTTTYNTYLARDGGRVGIGTTSPESTLHIQTPVGEGSSLGTSLDRGVHIGIDANEQTGIELVGYSAGGSAYIDFHDAQYDGDYDMRIALIGNDELSIEGGNIRGATYGFGGMYTLDASAGGTCLYGNPAAGGACVCPAGFAMYNLGMNVYDAGSNRNINMYYCFR